MEIWCECFGKAKADLKRLDAIANKLGLSLDTVRGFCKRNRLTGYADAAKLNHEDMVSNGNICPNCGMIIDQTGKGRRKRFCSDKCRTEWWTKNYEQHNFSKSALHKIVCAGCGKTFVSYSNVNRKYCSHECYIKSRFGGKEDDRTH